MVKSGYRIVDTSCGSVHSY